MNDPYRRKPTAGALVRLLLLACLVLSVGLIWLSLIQRPNEGLQLSQGIGGFEDQAEGMDAAGLASSSTIAEEHAGNDGSNSINGNSDQHDASVRQPSEASESSTTVQCSGKPREHKIPICFVTASFFEWAKFADRLQNVTRLFQDIAVTNNDDAAAANMKANNDDMEECHNLLNMKFFVFTNLPRLPAPGWRRIVQSLSERNYTRMITHSRWPKFMGWQHPTIQKECSVVFYMDAIADLIAKPSAYQRMAQRILQSDVGLSQYLHRGGGGPAKEFRRVLYAKKDLPEHVNASLAWLAAQPDYSGNCTLYENRYFGYNVQSQRFREVSTFFWDRYSREVDSWRDQPLWCYALEHFQITPLPLHHEQLFSMDVRRMGKKKHKYGEESIDNAIQVQERRNRRFIERPDG